MLALFKETADAKLLCFSADDKSLRCCLRETFSNSHLNYRRPSQAQIFRSTHLAAPLVQGNPRALHAHSGPLIALVEAGILGASRIDDFGVKL
jgi:hypothetical protein